MESVIAAQAPAWLALRCRAVSRERDPSVTWEGVATVLAMLLFLPLLWLVGRFDS